MQMDTMAGRLFGHNLAYHLLRVGECSGWPPGKETRYEALYSLRGVSGTDHATILTKWDASLGARPHHGAIVSNGLKPKLKPALPNPMCLL